MSSSPEDSAIRIMRGNYEGKGTIMLGLGMGQLGEGWFSKRLKRIPGFAEMCLACFPQPSEGRKEKVYSLR